MIFTVKGLSNPNRMRTKSLLRDAKRFSVLGAASDVMPIHWGDRTVI